MEGRDSRRAGNGTGDDRPATLAPAPAVAELTDRQLLEAIYFGIRGIQPLVDAAMQHPIIRALLRRT